MQDFLGCGKLLDRQRYNYPSDWLKVDLVEEFWLAFCALV